MDTFKEMIMYWHMWPYALILSIAITVVLRVIMGIVIDNWPPLPSWRVCYEAGRHSMPMPRWMAEDYAKIYHAPCIEHTRTGKVITL